MDEIEAGLATWKTQLLLSTRGEATPDARRWLNHLLRTEVAALDLLASRFRPDSEVSAVNGAAGRWVDVSWDFVAVLTACLDAADATDGLCDPLLGAHVVAAGYDDWAAQSSSAGAAPSTARYQGIEIAAGPRVRIPPSSALDLGAVAKGWLADRLATTVHASTGWDCLANVGGDLRVVAPREGWVVAAETDDGRTTDLELQDAGLATSGTGHRRWRGGHHIIDPATGCPADAAWDSVSVLAATAAEANAAATAGMVLGLQAPAWLESRGLDAWCSRVDSEALTGRWSTWREPVPATA